MPILELLEAPSPNIRRLLEKGLQSACQSMTLSTLCLGKCGVLAYYARALFFFCIKTSGIRPSTMNSIPSTLIAKL